MSASGSAFERIIRPRTSVPSSSTTLRLARCALQSARPMPKSESPLPVFPRRRQRLRDRSHAAHHVPIEALQLVFAAAQQMKQQSNRCSRLIRPAMLAVDIVGQKHRLHFLRFVIVIEKFSQASGKKRNQLRNLSTRNSAKPFASAKQIAPAPQGRRINLRRRLHKKRLQIPRQLFQLIVHLEQTARHLSSEIFPNSAFARSRSTHHGTTCPSGKGT